MMPPSETKFTSDVKSAFSFLVEKKGYSVDTDENGVVTFSSDCLAVRVFREPGSYMIYVEVQRNDTREAYLLHEILHALARSTNPNPSAVALTRKRRSDA